MRVKVTLMQYNLTDHEEKMIADGSAILEKNTLKYKELEEDALHFVKFEDDTVTLERRCEISSVTVLNKDAPGKAIVKSPFGDMDLQTKTTRIEKKYDEWIVEYGIFSENNEIFQQRLVWKIKYLS